MTSDPLEDVLPALKEAVRQGGWDALASLPSLGESFDYAPKFPLVNVRLPLQDLADAIPVGHTGEEFIPAFKSLIEALSKGDQSLVKLPEGVTGEELRQVWNEVTLWQDSGAFLLQKVQFSKELAKAHIAAQGLDRVLLVLDEDFRVIVGLEYFWALSEMDEYEAVPVAILRNAPFDAGFRYIVSTEDETKKTFRKNNQLQEALISASPEEREAFRSVGFFFLPEKITLTCSPATLDRLGTLIRKQLGGRTKLDPAQMLYVEALREKILDVRERMIREGKTAGGVVEKLQLHLKEEREMLDRGAKIEAKKGWRWVVDEDGLYRHPAMPRYRFKVQEPEPRLEATVETAVEDPYLMSASQFVILARTHFGLDAEEATALHGAESAEAFNRRLKRYVKEAPQVAPKLTGEPSEAERANQRDRLALWSREL
ncbi:hypothetical protein [Microbacterium sp. CIAB417]|uniref:hypothetical protein n=1 Tax=Microbacterium sp. CIAB417 TaxID=2860287 RepID=UPI001FAC9999|nr:hypothetical protein [Microbacterium sp. CIAB417]